jgi:hypothetical protein
MIARPVSRDQRRWNKGLLVCRKNLSNRSTSGPFEFVKKSHDRGATLSSLSRSCVTLIMRTSGAVYPMYLYSLRVAAPSPEARNRGGGRTSNPNLGGCPSHH